MKRLFPVLVVIPIVLLATSCATTPPKQAAIQGEGVLAAVRAIANAYEKRDLDAFMDAVSVAYPERDTLEKSVAGVFSEYQTIRFTIHYTRMLIEIKYQGKINATFTWEGEWQTAGGKTVKDGARGTLIFDPGTYKLMQVEGKNPFVPQPGETPGKQ
jgi:hypothetical protein